MPSIDDEVAALRGQLRVLSDRLEIRDLLDRYVVALDTIDETADDDWFSELFTEDARFTFPIGSHTGLAGLAAFQRKARARWARTHHLSANHRIEQAGDTATVRVHQLATHVHQGGDPSRTFDVGGYYEGRAVRTPSGWRFDRLSFHVVWSTGERLAEMTGAEF
ncbi:nuclear transport factor 2 family protein [Streptomyces poriticola]|uniref:nuclear transport factor 2 family protein n=1 Tax=Streptomyces poriticola TaxID=3120506 RepID=UPI002FCE6154